jgi:hypothetical protein
LAEAGLLSKSAANPIIEEAYKGLVEKYPNCDKFKYASLKLADLNFEEGKWAEAASYYELLLTKFSEKERPARILYQLGRAYNKMGKMEETVKICNEYLMKTFKGDPHIAEIRQDLERLTHSAKDKRILSDVILGTIYGGCAGRFCAEQPWCPGACTFSGYGGVCMDGSPPTCTWIGPCTCNESCKRCFDEPEIGPCVDTTTSCATSCYPSSCYPSGNTCEIRTMGVSVPCTSSKPWCD